MILKEGSAFRCPPEITLHDSGSARTALAQPQLRLDVGDLYRYEGHLYLDIEYQYWHNKFDIKGGLKACRRPW